MASKPKVVVLVAGAVIGACLIGAQAVSKPVGPGLVSVLVPTVGLAGTSVVNIESDPSSGVPLAANQLVPVYTVPSDRWLLLTDFECSGYFSLVEIEGSTTTIKRGLPFTQGPSYHSATGLAFGPGTQVGLKATDINTTAQFTMSGYLTRP